MDTDIAAFLDSYIAAWNSMDFDALAGHWAVDEDEIYYVAEEVDTPLYTFAAVRDYWARTAATIEWVRIDTSDARSRLLDADLAALTYQMHVDASMRGYEQQGFKPVGSDVRASAILRRTEAGWRLIHYAEAPLGALPFLRRVYNANVRS